MKNLNKNISMLLLFAMGAVTTQLYQNCAPFQMEGFAVLSSEEQHAETETGTGGHPTNEKETTLPTRKQLVVPRTYVAGIMREVFTSAKFPISNLEAQIDKWVMFKGAQYGGACNFYSTYSARDCSGSNANANIGHYTDDNTVRESFRIQMCENILGLDAGVNAALEKAGLTSASAVNSASLIAVHGLFYRSNPPEANFVATLVDLNNSLTEQKATALNKWRAMLSQICESPGWQLL